MKTTSMVCAAVACAVVVGCGQPAPPAAAPDGAPGAGAPGQEEIIGRKILHKKEVPEFPGKEGVVYVSSLPKNGNSGRHTHPGQELSYVISGKVHVDVDGNPELSRDVAAGESFSNNTNKVHAIKNVGNEPAKIVTFIIIDKGAVLATPVE